MSEILGKIRHTVIEIINRIPRNVSVNVSSVSRDDVLEGSRILIIGGSRGIGASIARRCAEDGAKIIITGRDEDALRKTSESIGDRCNYIVYDNRDFDRIDWFYDQSFAAYGGVDSVVYNSGISLHERSFLEVSTETFDKQIDINLKAAYFISQKFIKEKNKDQRLNLLYISSESAYVSDYLPYNLSKVALNSLIRGLAKQYYRDGIRVNGIAPGMTVTQMIGMDGKKNFDAKNYSPGRYFSPDEMAEVVVFLLSDASQCISGEIIPCAGGHQVHTWG